MRTTFDDMEGGGGWAGPADPPRLHPVFRALIVAFILVAAFGWGLGVAAAWEALSDVMGRAA